MATTGDDKKDLAGKVDVAEHHENGDEAISAPKNMSAEAAARGQGISGYESLSPWQTILHFKMNALICFAITFSAATDGYQIGYVERLPGSRWL